MGRARAHRGRSAEEGAEAWGSGVTRVAASSHPAPFTRCPIPPPPPCTFARAFHVLPPACTHRARPPPRSELRGTPPPPPPHDPECTRRSPGWVPRAVFFPPLFPPPPPGADCAPTHGQGLGSAQARGCTGRARGAGSAWAGNTFRTPPLSGSPSSVPPGPVARLRVRAKCRAEARSLGTALPIPCGRPRSLLLAPQRALSALCSPSLPGSPQAALPPAHACGTSLTQLREAEPELQPLPLLASQTAPWLPRCWWLLVAYAFIPC
ncbi:unnamed protein product [Rangifer tarandus platyrhynchus]|uniref:Uncharacterized protein n=1 Tax=Rangifer tarandus platyrhynchus TaxID=3082113 RepID=A0ABN8Z8T8_RANTA|nr:unnamed protein product [Rangifer tarandus platyrhynchus]